MRVSKGAVDSGRSGGLRLNGVPITAIASGTLKEQIRKVALRLADDDLLDAEEMAPKVGCSPERIASHISKLDSETMAKIRVGTRQRRVFGNPKTIKKLVTALERA